MPLAASRWLLLLAASSASTVGCQVVFGLDDYIVSGSGTEGAGAGTGSGWQPTACQPRLPEIVGEGGEGFCRSRPLDPLNTPDQDLSPSAYCAASACFVYFERRVFSTMPATDTLMCAVCNDIGKLDCDPAKGVVEGVINPYFRALQPEIWVSFKPTGGSYDIHWATVNGCSPITTAKLTRLSGPVSSTADETYPAISPDATTLYFTRCSGASCRIYVTHRSSPSVDFPDGKLVDGIRANAPATAGDLQAQPIWVGVGHGASALYFASTRLGKDVTDYDQLDVFVATRAPNAAWDAPFDPPRLVRQLSDSGSDFSPVPVLPQYWLQARRSRRGDTNLHLLDVGCRASFGEPTAEAFAAVDAPNAGELGPAFLQSSLLLSRGARGQETTLQEAPRSGAAYAAPTPISEFEVDHVAGTFDRDPAPSRDGRLLFVSNRGGIAKVWTAAVVGSPVRATTSADADEESTPFVDAQGALWLSLRASGQGESVIAIAPREGDSWGSPTPLPGLGHQLGRMDTAPRLTDDGLRLYFASTRSGGFAPGARSIWVATRGEPNADWDPANVFPVPELSGITSSTDPWPAQDGCSVTLSVDARQPGRDDWSWDIVAASWAAK